MLATNSTTKSRLLISEREVRLANEATGGTHMLVGQRRWVLVTLQMVRYRDCHGNAHDTRSGRSRCQKLASRGCGDKGQGLCPQESLLFLVSFPPPCLQGLLTLPCSASLDFPARRSRSFTCSLHGTHCRRCLPFNVWPEVTTLQCYLP